MYISHKYRFIFLRTPKTASSSLMDFFVNNIDDPSAVYGPIEDTKDNGNLPEEVYKKYQQNYKIYHLTLQELLDSGVINTEQLNSYYNFAILRDPVDRQKSFYYFFRKWRGRKGPGTLQEYNAFVNQEGWFDGEPNSAIKQTDFLTLHGIMKGDYWLYENLDNQLTEFMNKLNIDITHPLKTFKGDFRSNRDAEFKFDKPTVETMATYFRDDFNLYSQLKVKRYEQTYSQSVEGFYSSH